MNLETIISSNIQKIVPKRLITLKVFSQTIADNAGIVTTSYTTINNIYAQVQLENKQKLVHKDYFNDNAIYYRFYIQSNTLSGLNRNLGTAGDYIIMNDLYYKIVEVPENFNVGWVQVIGAQSTDGING